MSRAILFGKLPVHGDFVARGLSARERDALDGWLSASMLDAQAALGSAFADLYDRAPPWRFARNGDDGWVAGAIAPSIDAAGRRFPLLVGCTGLREEEVDAATAAAEGLLYRALAEGWTADATVAALDEAEHDGGGGPAREGWWTLGASAGEDGVGFAAMHVPGASPPALARRMLTAEVA